MYYSDTDQSNFLDGTLELDGLYERAKSGRKLLISDVDHLIKKRLKDAGFILSPSQVETIGDGNCFLYATKDQLRYVNAY